MSYSPAVPSLKTMFCACPLGFDFDDKRDDKNVKRVIEKKSGARYGFIGNDKNGTLRAKFAALFFGQAAFNVVFRMPIRLAKLMECDFKRIGTRQAVRELRTECARKTKEANAGKKTWEKIVQPEETELRNLIWKKSLWQLVKNIMKLVTYPIAIVGLQLATVYGLINPNGGRVLYAMIEEAWAREELPEDVEHTLEIKWGEYFAACMQPDDIVERDNLLPSALVGLPYHKDTLRSLMSHLNRVIKREAEFYKTTGVDVEKLLATIKKTKEYVSVNGRRDSSEITNGHLDHTAKEQELAGTLKKILLALTKIEDRWNDVVDRKDKDLAAFELRMKENLGEIEALSKKLNDEMPKWSS